VHLLWYPKGGFLIQMHVCHAASQEGYLQVVFIHEQCFAQIPACEIMKMPFACQQANILILLVSDIFALCLTMQIEVSEQDVEQVILIDAHVFHCMRALAALHSC